MEPGTLMTTFSMTDAVAAAIRWIMETVGLTGIVSASAVISVMMALYWSQKLYWLMGVAKHGGVLVVQHAVVSTLVVLSLFGAALYYQVIPGVDLNRLLDLLEGFV